MKKTYFILVCFLSLSLLSFSQEEVDDDAWDLSAGQKYKNYIGFGAGFTTGFGLTYKYMPKNYGIMLTVSPYYSEKEERALVSGGITLEKAIARYHACLLFVYLSNSIMYEKYRDYNEFYVYDPFLPVYEPSSYDIVKYTSWNSGIGLGFEVHSAKRVVVNLMLGYAQYDNFKTIAPTAEIFLFYRFNSKL